MPDAPDDVPCLQSVMREALRAYRAKYNPSIEEVLFAMGAVGAELITELVGPLTEDGLAPDAERPATKPH